MDAPMFRGLSVGGVMVSFDIDTKLKQARLSRAVDIVAAYVAKNPIKPSEVKNLITSVYSSLDESPAEVVEDRADQLPATSVKKSITPDYLICLEDGKKVKMLKRYLRTNFGMTPAQYRTKWGLPLDYPMAAPNYTQARSDFAKLVGFGRKKKRTLRAAKV